MGKEVEGLNFFDGVTGFTELNEVAHLGGGVAGDIDHATRPELGQLVEKSFSATFAGRVDDESCFGAVETEIVEDALGGGSEDFDVWQIVELGVAACKVG